MGVKYDYLLDDLRTTDLTENEADGLYLKQNQTTPQTVYKKVTETVILRPTGAGAKQEWYSIPEQAHHLSIDDNVIAPAVPETSDYIWCYDPDFVLNPNGGSWPCSFEFFTLPEIDGLVKVTGIKIWLYAKETGADELNSIDVGYSYTPAPGEPLAGTWGTGNALPSDWQWIPVTYNGLNISAEQWETFAIQMDANPIMPNSQSYIAALYVEVTCERLLPADTTVGLNADLIDDKHLTDLVKPIYLMSTYRHANGEFLGAQGATRSAGILEVPNSGFKLHLLVSTDGEHFEEIDERGVYQDPDTPWCRNVAITYWNGKFWGVYAHEPLPGTPSSAGYFDIISSEDLINWTKVGTTPAYFTRNGNDQIFAPTWYVYEDTPYLLMPYQTAVGGSWMIYVANPTNDEMTTWSEKTAIFETGAGKVTNTGYDPCIQKYGDNYYLFMVEGAGDRVVRAVSSQPFSGYVTDKTGDWAGWGDHWEKTVITQLDDGTYRAYFDRHIGLGTGFSDSEDLETWTPIKWVDAKFPVPGVNVYRFTDPKLINIIQNAYNTGKRGLMLERDLGDVSNAAAVYPYGGVPIMPCQDSIFKINFNVTDVSVGIVLAKTISLGGDLYEWTCKPPKEGDTVTFHIVQQPSTTTIPLYSNDYFWEDIVSQTAVPFYTIGANTLASAVEWMLTCRFNGTDWELQSIKKLGSLSEFLTDAPSDGKSYGRKDGDWSEVTVDLSGYATTASLSSHTGSTGTSVHGLGTASTATIGTSGATVPLLNTANSWSATQTFQDINIEGDTANRVIAMGRETTAGTAGRSLTISAGGAASGSTNAFGGDLILAGGVSTGTGSSKVDIKIAFPGVSSGTSDNALQSIAIFQSYITFNPKNSGNGFVVNNSPNSPNATVIGIGGFAQVISSNQDSKGLSFGSQRFNFAGPGIGDYTGCEIIAQWQGSWAAFDRTKSFSAKSDVGNQIINYYSNNQFASQDDWAFFDRFGAKNMLGHTFFGSYRDEEVGLSIVTNGAFATDDNWTKGTGWTIGSGIAAKAAGSMSAIQQDINPTLDRLYKVSLDVTAVSSLATFAYVFKVWNVVAPPALGDTYTFGGKTYTIAASSIIRGRGFIVASGTGDPGTNGNLTRTSGSGDDSIVFYINPAYNKKLFPVISMGGSFAFVTPKVTNNITCFLTALTDENLQIIGAANDAFSIDNVSVIEVNPADVFMGQGLIHVSSSTDEPSDPGTPVGWTKFIIDGADSWLPYYR